MASFGRPGGNLTGNAGLGPELDRKRIELLKELVPSLSRATVPVNPTNVMTRPRLEGIDEVARAIKLQVHVVEASDTKGHPDYRPGLLRFKGTEKAGRKLGITIVSVQFPEGSDTERAFAEIRRARAEAVTVLSDPVLVGRRAAIIELAARHRLPAIYALREFIEDGGLISYATSLTGQWRRAARYVDRILKGANPGELPIEQPAAFELWIKAKAARAMGLTIPPSLLLRADQVIE